MLDAITHPVQTVENIGNVAQGAVSQAAGAMGIQQDPAQKAKNESLISALENHYKTTYGSVPGFKKALAIDPASVAMDASTLLGGAGALADTAGLAKTAGVLSKVGSAIDPVANAVRVAKIPAKIIAPVARGASSIMAGVPTSALELATKAGASTNPAVRAAYSRFVTGQGDATEFAQAAQKAVGQIRNDASSEYLAGKGDLANTTPSFQPINDAVSKARETTLMGGINNGQFPEANKAIDDVEQMVNNWQATPDAQYHDLNGIDNLKRAIWDKAQDYSAGTEANSQLMGIYHGARKALVDADPKYADLMDQYQVAKQNINDLTKTLGTGQKTAASATLVKNLKALKSPTGENLLQQLMDKDPTIGGMLAGAALHPWHRNGSSLGEVTAGLLPLAFHNPAALVSSIPAAMAASSPRIAGALNYGAGAASRVGEKVASSPLTDSAYYTGRADQEQEQPPAVPSDANGIFQKMLHQESGNQQFDKSGNVITSPKGAIGAAQIMPGTGPEAAKLAGVDWDPNRLANDPDYNRLLGQAYHAHLSEMFGDPIAGAAAYNAGPSRVKDALAKASEGGKSWLHYLPSETQKYVQAITGSDATPAKTGGRIMRATGGATSRMTHEQLVDRLMKLAKQAKRAANKKTEPLLNVPDDVITKALSVAQRAI
jgi:soluble lytic murein transglycosylase-like protein